MGGLARCLIHMARLYAPQARVGLHGSPWGTGRDVVSNRDQGLDVVAEAHALGDFLVGMGAGEGDFLAVDVSDRDAGYDEVVNHQDTWWDATNATLPHFAQALAWSKALSERVGLPVIWWQVPVGHSGLDDTRQRYRDNRVDYLLTHLQEVAQARVAGLLFGAGTGENTTPDTDDGNLVNRVRAASPPACQ